MFNSASNFVEGVDNAFIIIFSISIFFLVGITAVMIYFLIRYNKKRNPKATQIKENTTLEVIWLVVPLVIVMFMFYYGYIGYKPMRNPPSDAIEIKVTGKMWSWIFEYPGKKVSDELWVPLNKPIILKMYSLDVTHSLYIPSFRIKEDVVPGMETFMWFIPTLEGEYDILCAEYCGLRHSYMMSKIHVMPQDAYEKKIASLSIRTNREEHLGFKIMQANACGGCHSSDGTKLVGPSFKKLFGGQRIVSVDGKEQKITVDSAYIYQSIVEPDAQVVKGYNKGIMRSYKSSIKEEDLQQIIQFFKLPDEE